MELDEASRPKSAFLCRKGLFEFVRLPFGLSNAPATLQRLMDSVLAGLKWQSCLVYLDDIVVFSSSFDEHLAHLRQVLLRISEAGLSIKLAKCRFASTEIDYLGFLITPDGLKPNPSKIAAISDFPVPSSSDDVRSFLGLAGYFRSFVSQFSVKAAPLNALLKKDVVFSWSPETHASFLALKQALLADPVLRFPVMDKPFEIHSDGACTAGIGAILGQRDETNKFYAVSYISRSLSPAERNYGVSEVEALAIVWAIKSFAAYITGSHFTVITDHQALTFLMNSVDLRGRLARWALLLQQHSFTIKYRPGVANSSPDSLSRHPMSHTVAALRVSDLMAAQAKDDFCQSILSSSPGAPFSVPDGVLYHGSQIVLPVALRQSVFYAAHSIPMGGHLGFSKTVSRISSSYWFPSLPSWVRSSVQSCQVCQAFKSPRRSLGHSSPSTSMAGPFDTVAIDTYGPLPRSINGNRYVLVMQDVFSRYVILAPVPQNSDTELAKAISERLIAEHGCARVFMSDNGQPYAAHLIAHLCKHLSISQRFAPMYHPQSNGLVERFMSTLRSMIATTMVGTKNTPFGIKICTSSHWPTILRFTPRLRKSHFFWLTVGMQDSFWMSNMNQSDSPTLTFTSKG